MYIFSYEQTDRPADIRVGTERRTDRQTDREADIRTDRLTFRWVWLYTQTVDVAKEHIYKYFVSATFPPPYTLYHPVQQVETYLGCFIIT